MFTNFSGTLTFTWRVIQQHLHTEYFTDPKTALLPVPTHNPIHNPSLLQIFTFKTINVDAMYCSTDLDYNQGLVHLIPLRNSNRYQYDRNRWWQ